MMCENIDEIKSSNITDYWMNFLGENYFNLNLSVISLLNLL